MPGYGALDALDCPHCQGKGFMVVTRRAPDPEQRMYELQTFRCASCNKSLERIVDKDGQRAGRSGVGAANAHGAEIS